MNNKITLILDRKMGDLWLVVNGSRIACIWNVTGLKSDEESLFNHVRILRKGRQIGGFWHVEEIKERW